MVNKMDQLLDLLTLEQVEKTVFLAHHPAQRRHRLFGGQIMAQALMAASQTVEVDRVAHSLHGYFLRPGDPATPALMQVELTRDGRSFSMRRVTVSQHGEAIFTMEASFQVPESGVEHQAEMPDLKPPPEEKIPEALRNAPFITWRHEFRRLQQETPQPPQQFVWFKPTGRVPEGVGLAQALLLYESDNTLLGTARLPHRGRFEREDMQVAGLDHAMWFHRAADLNQWLLYAIDTPSSSNARGYTRGHIFTEDGLLLASTAQEGLIRVHGASASRPEMRQD